MQGTAPLPSSHRTCGFPASGGPRYLSRDRRSGSEALPAAAGLGGAAISEESVSPAFPPGIRSGTVVQAALPSSYLSAYLMGSLRSTGVTPLPRYYEPRRLPNEADVRLWFPAHRWTRGPLRRVSQVPRLILQRAPPPTTPESPSGACAHCFPDGDRLRHRLQVGRLSGYI